MSVECCVCDEPTCAKFPCEQLREFRIAHRVISDVVKVREFGVETIRDLLDFIESECEILSK